MKVLRRIRRILGVVLMLPLICQLMLWLLTAIGALDRLYYEPWSGLGSYFLTVLVASVGWKMVFGVEQE